MQRICREYAALAAAAASKKIDLHSFTLPELRELATEVAEQIVAKEKSEKADLLAEFEQRAKERGFSLADLLPSSSAPVEPEKPKGEARATVPPKYRHPSEPLQVWSGRGRQPKWVQEHLAGGGGLDDLLIPAG